MSIEEIIDLYNKEQLPDTLDELGRIQSKVDDYAKSSLELAHAAKGTEPMNEHFNRHVTYITIRSYLDYKICKALNMEGGSKK